MNEVVEAMGPFGVVLVYKDLAKDISTALGLLFTCRYYNYKQPLHL